jgi:hypothetical protein
MHVAGFQRMPERASRPFDRGEALHLLPFASLAQFCARISGRNPATSGFCFEQELLD